MNRSANIAHNENWGKHSLVFRSFWSCCYLLIQCAVSESELTGMIHGCGAWFRLRKKSKCMERERLMRNVRHALKRYSLMHAGTGWQESVLWLEKKSQFLNSSRETLVLYLETKKNKHLTNFDRSFTGMNECYYKGNWNTWIKSDMHTWHFFYDLV